MATTVRKIHDIPVLRVGDSVFMARCGTGDRICQTEVFSLNDTAAELWEMIPLSSVPLYVLTGKMTEIYEVPSGRIGRDIASQLDEWAAWGLVELSD